MGETWPFFGLTLAALGAESILGYPQWLHRRVPHPVVWIGNAIGFLEHLLNRPAFGDTSRRLLGVITAGIVTGIGVFTGWVLTRLAGAGFGGFMLLAVLASIGLAQRSLYQHVHDVANALDNGDLTVARAAVARIVGRDVTHLDRGQIAAAGLESLGESFNDGIVAPAFWLAVGGLPGLFAYKAVNTADSLIGHREERWRAFGWAAARLDDAMNLIPARIAGALIALAGWGGWRVMLRDARKHASPNAGWPEAAMAGALSVRLGGAAFYDGVATARPVFGDGAEPNTADLARGLRLYVRACGLLWLAMAAGAFLWPR